MKWLNRYCNNHEKGFSLIELIVVIAITGAIAGVISQTIMMMMDVVTQNRAHIDLITETQNAQRWLERDVKSAQFLEGIPNTGTWTSSMHLVSHTWTGTRTEILYFITPEGELRREETQYTPEKTNQGTVETLVARDLVFGGSNANPNNSCFEVSKDIKSRKRVTVSLTLEDNTGTRKLQRERRTFIIDPRPIR